MILSHNICQQFGRSVSPLELYYSGRNLEFLKYNKIPFTNNYIYPKEDIMINHKFFHSEANSEQCEKILPPNNFFYHSKHYSL
jgi:hypothetical protein